MGSFGKNASRGSLWLPGTDLGTAAAGLYEAGLPGLRTPATGAQAPAQIVRPWRHDAKTTTGLVPVEL
jgi:hypothetical protein